MVWLDEQSSSSLSISLPSTEAGTDALEQSCGWGRGTMPPPLLSPDGCCGGRGMLSLCPILAMCRSAAMVTSRTDADTPAPVLVAPAPAVASAPPRTPAASRASRLDSARGWSKAKEWLDRPPPAPALPVPRGEVMHCAPLEADEVGNPIVMVP